MSDSQCTICMCIFVEPITLPCEHCICKPCFDQILKRSNLECPLCRRRIGSWARLNARRGTLIDEKRWSDLKTKYPTEIKARLAGKSTPKKKGCDEEEGAMREIAQTGEIRREYEREMSMVQQERAEQELASEKLIKEILAQEEKELAAFRVANKENKPASAATAHSQSLRLRTPKRSSSLDSITGEYSRYFKPIARYPRTPPRPDEKAKGYPETIKVTPCPQTVKKLDFASGGSTPDVSTASSEGHSGPSSSKAAIVSLTNKRKLDSTEHPFVLPLQAIVDERSNDGLSVVSATTDASVSTCGLRISTTSPVIPIITPGTFSSVASSDRSETMSDTISYRSDISPQIKRRRGRSAATVKKNGHINSKSSRTRKRQVNGQEINGRTDRCASRCSSKNSVRSSTRRGSSARRGSSTASAKESASRSPANQSSNGTGAANSGASNGCSLETAFVDPDEVYARKLQAMYNAETKYKLSTLRFAGTENEYNTRKRARPPTNS